MSRKQGDSRFQKNTYQLRLHPSQLSRVGKHSETPYPSTETDPQFQVREKIHFLSPLLVIWLRCPVWTFIGETLIGWCSLSFLIVRRCCARCTRAHRGRRGQRYARLLLGASPDQTACVSYLPFSRSREEVSRESPGSTSVG